MSIRTTQLKWEGKETHPTRQIPRRPSPCLAGPLIYDQWGCEPDTPNTLWGKHRGFMNLKLQQGNERDRRSLTSLCYKGPKPHQPISHYPLLHKQSPQSEWCKTATVLLVSQVLQARTQTRHMGGHLSLSHSIWSFSLKDRWLVVT